MSIPASLPAPTSRWRKAPARSTALSTTAPDKVPIIGTTITVTDAKTGVAVATSPASVVSDAAGTFTETLPPGTYYVTATPPATSGYAVQTGSR